MHNQHIWTERSPAENGRGKGEKREVRALKFGGIWRIQSKLSSEPQWTYHDPPLVADLATLHDLLFRKYQRRRAAYEDVVLIEKMLRERSGSGEEG